MPEMKSRDEIRAETLLFVPSRESPLEEQDKNGYRAFLQDCMKENLAHARHIENQRHNFLSLHLVVVGLFLATIISPDTSPWISLIFSVVLLMFSNILAELFKRWDRVYNAHLDTAKRLTRLIDNYGEEVEEPKFCPIDEDKLLGHHPNYYYYFDNTVGKKALEERVARAKREAALIGKDPWVKDYKAATFRDCWKFGKDVYIRTNSLYMRFCHLVSAVEILAMVLAVFRILKQHGIIDMIMEII